ncbi:hypothetical protein FRC10_008602 [Ceratobasidium sp. 414]|nr:hypothetical protein FRC10_008602 [Ceratobasidium sp. 414]
MKRSCAVLLFGFATSTLSQSISIQVTKNATHSIPSTLYGWMWEDINHSGEGGLYAELLQNRAFQIVTPHTSSALAGWAAYNGATIDVTNSTSGVSKALPNSLQVTVPTGSTGSVGFQNTGYWGMKVQSGWIYTGSFYVKSGDFAAPITISLVSTTSGQVYATKTLTGVAASWKKLSFSFKPTASAPDNNNVLRFSVDAASSVGKTLHFGMFSLFPPTYKNKPNGMRVDLAETLVATKPGIFRFPGGNNLEGGSASTRWKWNETIGPDTLDKDSRIAQDVLGTGLAVSGYVNTDGLGLMEYFNWIEDIGTEPILGIWSGLGVGADGNPAVPESEVQPYVQDAINEIQFLTGDANTNQWAKLRAQYGHPAPYKLKYIEIGNEDWVSADTYARYRWKAFVTGLEAAFPNSGFEYLATTYPETSLTPAYTYIDVHQYNIPAWFIEHALEYDNYPRNRAQIFFGEYVVLAPFPEYAVTSTNSSCVFGPPSCGRLVYPTLQGAVAEAAFLTGLERNSDVVFASSYAPTMQHISSAGWSPNIASFDAGSVVKSPSYYVQHMFSTNLGTEVIKTTPTPSASIPLHWVASHDTKSKTVYIKASNTANTTYTAKFALGFPISNKSVGLTLLTASNATVSNTLETPDAAAPKTSTISVGSGAASFSYTMPANSVAVFNIKTNW